MTPDARRRTLVDATRSLLAEHGPDVSTRRIAEAAGVAEGTIFRVFETKQDLIEAVIADSFTADAVVAAIEAIPEADTLRALVKAMLRVLLDDMESNRAVMDLLSRPAIAEKMRQLGASRTKRGRAVGIAVARRLAAFADQITLPLPKAALFVSAMAFLGASYLPSAVVFDDLDDLTTVLLHGISKD